ncbi:MAG: substrate-binding protein [Endomicrobiales bacterium]|nr:substrate-binding protein [Endomicrobiales bacterium]
MTCGNVFAADTVKIGFNYPETGPYYQQGIDQKNGTELAVEEINAGGGILGRKIEIVKRDSQSKGDQSKKNCEELIAEGVKMIFGGSASSVAVAAGEVCQKHGILFFGTLTYSTETTDEKGHRHTFRECYNSWAAAKVLSSYMRKNFTGKRYMYITADYTWGHTTESSFRKFTGTQDKELHKGVLTKFPGATEEDFRKVISFAKMVKPDVLVLVEFGEDMVMAIREATAQGLKDKTHIVVPNLTLAMAKGGGPRVMSGVLGALDWFWNIPYKYNYPKGKAFVEKYAAKYGSYPGSSANYCWNILHEYKAAVERAGSFDSAKVIKALEGHKYQYNKDEQYWRPWDHSSIQTVYAVRCKPESEVVKDKYKLDYFEVINTMPGERVFRTKNEWIAARSAVNMPSSLEKLPGE